MRVLPIVLLVGCPAPEPVDTDPPTPVPLVQAEPRTLTFTLVPDLGNGTVLDLDLDVDGRSAAVIQKSLGDGEVWVDTGAGWTLIFEVDARLPTCVALEPGGDRLLVGANAGIAYILRDDGSIVRDAMQVGLAAHPLRQCAWTDDTLAVSQSSENGVEGGVWAANYTNPEFLTWVEQVPEFRTYQDLPLWDGIYGADGLSLGSGGLLTVGVSFSLPGSPTETVVSGTANADVWSTNPASDSVAPGWGRPRDFGDFPGNGGGQLFRRPGQSTVWTTGPVGTFGLAELTPAGATGVLYAMDVAADGHLWLGGDQGLYRSDEVLRSGP